MQSEDSQQTDAERHRNKFSDCSSVCLTVSTLFTSQLNTAGSLPLRAASIMFTVEPPEPKGHKSFKAWTRLIRFSFFFEGQEQWFSDSRRKSIFIDKGAAPFAGVRGSEVGGGELSQLLT